MTYVVIIGAENRIDLILPPKRDEKSVVVISIQISIIEEKSRSDY